MKFKKAVIPVLTAIILLTACSSSYSEITEISEIPETAPQTQAQTETETETEAETEWENPALAPAKLADRSPSEFTISGSIIIYDEKTHTSAEYAGEITAEEDIAAIWDFIAFTEASPACDVIEYNSVKGDMSVCLTLKKGSGERYSYNETSFTENGEEAGYIRRLGVGSKDTLYIPFKGIKAPLYSLMETILAKEENITSRVTYPAESYKSGAVLVREYRNWAWGYQHSGELIDINGNVYPFDFSDDEYENQVKNDDELVSRLMEIYSEGNPEASSYKKYSDKLEEISTLADKADIRAKLTCKPNACDAGQYTLYAINTDFRLIEISSWGDFEILSTDPNALEIQRLCNEMNIN